MKPKVSYYEFFAGGGMARAGFGDGWECLFANDNDELKHATYTQNWSGKTFDFRDVAEVCAEDLSGQADLAWASFPCQDLSQAGSKFGIGTSAGTKGTRSGTVWSFLGLIRNLASEGRPPLILALENVVGFLNANGGVDFRAICAALSEIGYRYGAIVANASHFVPQSRPRVFVIAIRREVPLPLELLCEPPNGIWHTPILRHAFANLPSGDAENWVWWMPGDPPPQRDVELADIIELGDKADWNSDQATERLIGMMSPRHLNRLDEAKAADRAIIGSLYLRMRPDGSGRNVQRAEIAFGPTLGCLRTPKGGASRPRIIVVNGDQVKTRLVSVSEAAALMGLGKDFNLPSTYHECFRLIGDGVVPSVVRFLADRLLEPLASHARRFVSWPADRKALS